MTRALLSQAWWLGVGRAAAHFAREVLTGQVAVDRGRWKVGRDGDL